MSVCALGHFEHVHLKRSACISTYCGILFVVSCSYGAFLCFYSRADRDRQRGRERDAIRFDCNSNVIANIGGGGDIEERAMGERWHITGRRARRIKKLHCRTLNVEIGMLQVRQKAVCTRTQPKGSI